MRQTLEALLPSRGPPADHRRPRDPRRAQPHPARDDAQGARRRRRRPPGAAAAGRPPASLDLRRGALRAGCARPASASSRRCSTTSRTDRVPDALPARAARRPRRRRLRPLRQLRRADALDRRSPTPRSAEAERAARPARASSSSRARCGRPGWPPSASTSRARSPTAPSEGRAVARLTDLGHGQALRELFREAPPTVRCRRPWSRPSSRCSATGARGSTATRSWSSSRRPGRR